MRTTMLVAVSIATLLSQAGVVLAQSARTRSEQADDTLAAALWHIAVDTGARIGFQSVEPLNPTAGALSDALVQAARDAATSATHHRPVNYPPLEHALDSAISANPRYEWRRLGGVVVVRPRAAWNDPHDPLNRPVRRFRAERSTDLEILTGVASLIHTGRYVERERDSTFVPPFAVESGSIVDILNGVIESADLPFWQAGYRRQEPERRGTHPDLTLILAKSTGILSASSSHAPSAAPRGPN